MWLIVLITKGRREVLNVSLREDMLCMIEASLSKHHIDMLNVRYPYITYRMSPVCRYVYSMPVHDNIIPKVCMNVFSE